MIDAKHLAVHRWQLLDISERRMALEEIENMIAQSQNRPSCDVCFITMKGHLSGYYHGGSIYLNALLIEQDQPKPAIETVLHEGRHAYQHYATNHPGFHKNEAEVVIWRNNLKNYITPEVHLMKYFSQPVEVDARDFAQLQVNNILLG
ncbi:MAG TPA: hypothetical protein VMW83_05030 [Spirochaetia bacterium]|nr:hypothetical protein [Spirochaetia bacterium]